MLIDSDVLIWFSRGHPGAAQRLNDIGQWAISSVSYMEVAQGCRHKQEQVTLRRILVRHGTRILHLTPAISRRACELVDQLSLSHGVDLGDALIGATAVLHGMPLLSADAKHFLPMEDLRLEVFSL